MRRSPLLKDWPSELLSEWCSKFLIRRLNKEGAKRRIDSLAKGTFSILCYFQTILGVEKAKGGKNTKPSNWGSVLTPRTSSAVCLMPPSETAKSDSVSTTEYER